MIVAIRIQQSLQGGEDEYVRLAEMATLSDVFAELIATARHYTTVRDQYHRATARSTCGKVLATVGMSPDALPPNRVGFRGRPTRTRWERMDT